MERIPDEHDVGVALVDPPERAPRKRRGSGREEPPRRGDDTGGGGGGGWRPDESDDGADGPRRRALSTSQFGFALTMVGVAGLFFVFFAGYLALRLTSAQWPPPGAPRPPPMLWVSTALLVGASSCLSRAVRTHAGAAPRSRQRWLVLASACGLAFVGAQVALWYALFARGYEPAANAYTSVLYVLTGIHAAHVIGGLVLLGCVLLGSVPLGSARRGLVQQGVAPRSARGRGDGEWIELCAWYWHAMGLVWALILALLYL